MSNSRLLRVGLIGYNFMGRAHSNAWRQAPRFFDLPARVELRTICGRSPNAVEQASEKLGWARATTDWRTVVNDQEIDIVDICTPNDSHAEIAVAAAQNGKAILCEKPLALDVMQAEAMLAAVEKAGVVHMVCHNYRRIPALALAKKMIERGDLGDRIYHFRARYAQDWIADPSFPLNWRLQAETSGSGAQGDINVHIIDLARYLVGEFTEVCGLLETFIKERPRADDSAKTAPVTVDDAVTWIGRFQNGALANLEATRLAHGRKNQLTLEINGSRGSLAFDLEDLNRLDFYTSADPSDRRGFRSILVTESEHPYVAAWWPPGHLLGYEHTFIHTCADFVKAVVANQNIQPTFADGLQNQRVLAALEQSARTKSWVNV